MGTTKASQRKTRAEDAGSRPLPADRKAPGGHYDPGFEPENQ